MGCVTIPPTYMTGIVSCAVLNDCSQIRLRESPSMTSTCNERTCQVWAVVGTHFRKHAGTWYCGNGIALLRCNSRLAGAMAITPR